MITGFVVLLSSGLQGFKRHRSYIIIINDLPEGIGSTVRLFADDAVMYLTIASQTDSHKLQTDINIAKWEKKWQMQFHPDKCPSA